MVSDQQLQEMFYQTEPNSINMLQFFSLMCISEYQVKIEVTVTYILSSLELPAQQILSA